MHTFQMHDADFASGIRFDQVGITSLTHSEYDNFVKWGPVGMLSGDGEENLGSGTTIALTAKRGDSQCANDRLLAGKKI